MWTPRVLTLVTWYQLAAVAAGSALSLWLWPTHVVGFLLGGAFATLNFWGLRILVERTAAVKGRRKGIYGLLLAFRMVLALALMAVLLLVFRVHPLEFALGLASTFVGVTLAMSHVAFTHKAPTA